jgi:hypothetical protein
VILALVLGLALGPSSSAVEARGAGTFRVEPDARLCPAPACGGVFVSLLNRALTRCADGEARPRCHASEVDLRRLELDGDRRAQLDQALAAGRLLLAGRLMSGGRDDDGGPRGRFVAAEAWIAATGAPAHGRFFRVTDRGIVCITTPCFSLREALINRAAVRGLSALDLGPSGAAPIAIADALGALEHEPLIVAGRNVLRPDAGPAGDGLELVAFQFYRRLAGPIR